MPQEYKQRGRSNGEDDDDAEGGRDREATPTHKRAVDNNASIDNSAHAGNGETSRGASIHRRHEGDGEEDAESSIKEPYGALRERNGEAIELEEEGHRHCRHNEGGEDEDDDSKTRELLYHILHRSGEDMVASRDGEGESSKNSPGAISTESLYRSLIRGVDGQDMQLHGDGGAGGGYCSVRFDSHRAPGHGVVHGGGQGEGGFFLEKDEFISVPSYSTPILGCIIEGRGEDGEEMP